MFQNFEQIRLKSQHLPTLSVLRQVDTVNRLCKAEYDDLTSKLVKSRQPNETLGKRHENYVFNMVREIDSRKIFKSEFLSKVGLKFVNEPMEQWSDDRKRQMIQFLGDNVQKLNKIRKLHLARNR